MRGPALIRAHGPAARNRRSLARRGSVAVEFALVAPLLLTLLAAVVDLGYAAYQSMQVQAAAEAGARYAGRFGWDPAAISAAVVNATGAEDIAANPSPAQFCGCAEEDGLVHIACDATCPGGATPARYAQVSAELEHATVLPYPGLPDPLTLRAYAIVRLQ